MISLLSQRTARETTSRCPLCRDDLQSEELRRGACGHCPSCETRYHRECFAEFGGCSTLGCPSYRQPIRPVDGVQIEAVAFELPDSRLDWEEDSWGPLPARYSWLKTAQVLGAVAATLSFLACVAFEWQNGFFLAFFLTFGVGLTAVDDWST